MTAAVRRELSEWRQLLEDRLGKPVRHFCYPWLEGSVRADQLAAGYRCVHYGVLAPRSAAGERALLRVPRLSEEYLLTLQGSSRVTPLVGLAGAGGTLRRQRARGSVVNKAAAPPARRGAEPRDPAMRPGRLLHSFGFLSAGKLLGDLCTFALFVVLSRAFGEAGIREYSFAIAFTGFFMVFADYGLYYLGLKSMSRSEAVPAHNYAHVLAIRLV